MMLMANEGELVVLPAQDEVLWMALALIFFALYIGVALWAWKDMNGRGRAGWLWGVLIIVAPVLGVVLWIIVRSSRPELVEGSGAG